MEIPCNCIDCQEHKKIENMAKEAVEKGLFLSDKDYCEMCKTPTTGSRLCRGCDDLEQEELINN